MNGTGDREGRPYVGWVVTIVIAFLIVIPVRHFCIESYRISTNAMEDALHQGDYILVNKLPLEGNPGRNKVVLFTSPLLKDTASNPLFLSRCIGMPGDTILVSGGGYEVNGNCCLTLLVRLTHVSSLRRAPPISGKPCKS